MKIREEQKLAFIQSLEDSFVKKMIKYLKDYFPKHIKMRNLQEEDLEPLVREGMTEAEKYGLFSEGQIQRYLEYKVILGPKFDQDERYPWAGEILRREDLDGEEKVDQISGNLLFEWEEPPE